jgi:RsiW-degrading membrane proteinase PrsW (M82 family)
MILSALHLLVALAPAIIFLLVLFQLESFKLVSPLALGVYLLAGAALAGVSYFANDAIVSWLGLDVKTYSYFGAPVVEEILKASLLVVLFLRNRIGFMVDAAIIGFAIGTGFAIAENSYLFHIFSQANVTVWVIRGFGTAMMHGGATAIFGVLAQSLTDRHRTTNPVWYLPGLTAAVLLHAAFNIVGTPVGDPVIATAGAFIVVPLALLAIFAKSEHGVHDWLIAEYNSHELLLAEIESGNYQHEAGGRFMRDLSERFGESTTEDIFAYLRIHTELSLRADKMTLDRENGRATAPTTEDAQSFRQLHVLEDRIGQTAMLAVWPHLKFSRRELWEFYRFERSAMHTKA